MMIVTPIAPGSVLAPCDLGAPRLVSELAPSVTNREANINMNRARLQRMFMNRHFPKYEFVLLLDSDVVVSKETVEKLLKAWKPGTTPCANTKGHEGGHVVASCALVGRQDYAEIDYMANPYECQCQKVPKPFYVEGATGTETRI